MPETDNPLKLLISQDAQVFTEWLLGRPVAAVAPLNPEFPAQAAQSDLLFRVIDTHGQLIYLHIELQGRRSHEPMPLRQLDYLGRLVRRDIGQALLSDEPPPPLLHSVVLYIGHGAGRDDRGQYEILGLGGQPTLRWQYQPIRLWEITAENLLQLDQPALLALAGLTALRHPQQELPAVVAKIRTLPSAEQRQRILTSLVSLLPSEEITNMVEMMINEVEELWDTPFLRRVRQKGLSEGLALGRTEGQEEGRENGLRQAILALVVQKLMPSAVVYHQLEAELNQVHDAHLLQQLLISLFDTADLGLLLANLQRLNAPAPDPDQPAT